MRKADETERVNEPLSEYDFRGGTRGKYYERYRDRTNVIVLSPDVAEVFPDSESVNNALRELIRIAREQVGSARVD